MSWDTATARTYRTTVRVGGVVRPHEATGINWAQDITSDLPDTVTAGGQVATRTGSIVWASEGVSDRPPSPWVVGGPWIPTVGEPVTIDVTDGSGNTHRVFTGIIDTVEGDAFGRRSSKIVAPLNGANRVVRRLAQTQTGGLPGSAVGRFATTPVWVISEIARELGYSSVPPPPLAYKRILDAPLQGSTYNYSDAPHTNAQVVASYRAGSPTLQPVWTSGRDGFGISNALIEWTPHTGEGTGAGGVGVSMLVYSAHTEDALVTIWHGSNITYLRAMGNGAVRASTEVGGSLVMHTAAETVPAGDGPHRVSAVYRDGQISIRVNGVNQTFVAPTPAGAVTRIRLDAGAKSCVAGLQVWSATSLGDHQYASWQPTAYYRYGTGTHSTVLAPSIRDEKAGEVLTGYAEALLCPLWVDGNGNLQVVTGKGLHDQTPTLTVDALRDVSELSYTMALLDHRPTVEVGYAHAFQSNITSTVHKTTVWQGSGGEVSPDAADETFVEIPDKEEWIGLADPATATRLEFDNHTVFNQGAGSWWGLATDITDPNYLTFATGGSQLVETLTPWAWKVTTTFTGADGAMQKAPTSAYIKGRYREMDLPIYRARSLVRYEDRTVAAASPGATDLDGVLAHDAGKWITTTSAATNLATWIHSMVGTPTPVLDGLRIRFDPRLEVGTKITVRAKAVFGADFQALVLSVDHDPGTDTTTVIARVTRVIATAVTFHDVDYAHIGQSLDYWDQARAGRTLDAVAAAPYTT